MDFSLPLIGLELGLIVALMIVRVTNKLIYMPPRRNPERTHGHVDNRPAQPAQSRHGRYPVCRRGRNSSLEQLARSTR